MPRQEVGSRAEVARSVNRVDRTDAVSIARCCDIAAAATCWRVNLCCVKPVSPYEVCASVGITMEGLVRCWVKAARCESTEGMMIDDSHHSKLPPPTVEEQLVVEHFLFECLHRHYVTSTANRGRQLISTCTACGEWHDIDDTFRRAALTPVQIADMWLRDMPRPATHLVVADIALAELSRHGWSSQFMEKDGNVVCTVRREGRVARSKSHPTRAAAMVDALSQVATNYRP